MRSTDEIGFSPDDIRDVVFRTDAEGRWKYLNAAWTEVTGFSREESLGESFLKYVHPDDRKRNLELFQPLILRKKDHCLHEIRYLTRDGGFKWIEVHARLTLAADGSATGTTGTLRDVTPRREAEDALQESETRFQAMADGAPVLLFLSNADGENIFVNRAYEEFLGVRKEGLPGNEWRRYVHPDDAPPYFATLERALRDKISFEAEVRIRRKDGAWRWVATYARRRPSASGEFLGHVGFALDVTDRKTAERALRDSEARYRVSEEKLRLALVSARMVEWEYDVLGGVVFVGPQWEEVTGVALPQPVPLAQWERLVHPDDLGPVIAAQRRVFEEGCDRCEAEYRVRSRDGTWRWLRSRGRATVRAEDGSPRRLSGMIMDVTEVHSLQENLVAATRLASVGTLAAGVAHEINNPLAWVTTNLSYALERVDAAQREAPAPRPDLQELRTVIEETQQGTARIGSIVRAMRSLGRPTDPSEIGEVDVCAEVLSAVQMTRTQVLQRARMLVEVPSNLPKVAARSNELGRVFLNLILNGAQAIPEGDEAHNFVAVRARTEGRKVVVEVSDSGSGIAPSIRDRIFEPFFTTKPPGLGTGLGLTMARSIVDSAGGSLELDAGTGQGSTFRVTLPASAPSVVPESAATSGIAVPPKIRGRVLIIDDEPLVGRSLQRILERRHDVTVLASGNEAMRLIDRGECWDAVLCDFTMPDLDGIALYEMVSARAPEVAKRWAFITGGVVGDRTARFLAGHDVFTLQKPVEPSLVLETVDRLAAR
ncbi:MAG TPA: PAS domain-containing protein [Anaeromyxobacter sp.]|nr:PAS domain-containing protein [Anaeromyxobacter sp.]